MEWFESEDFWINYGPVMFDEQRWAESADVAERVLEIVKTSSSASISKAPKILDAGCGPGRISVELALQGAEVTGVDIIEPFLEAAKESANDEGVSLNLLNADLRLFCELHPEMRESFDAAINLYTSFGYCDTEEEDTTILKNIFDSLKSGGIFILECTSRESAIKYFTEGEWFERAGKTVLTEFTVVGAWEGLNSKWILIDQKTGKRIEHCFVQRLYSAAELCKTLRKIGFSSAQVLGGFDGEQYDQNLKTMVIVAKK